MPSVSVKSDNAPLSPKEIDDLLFQAFETRINNLSKAIELAENALNTSQSTNYSYGEGYAYCYLGFFNMIQNEHQHALELSGKANVIFENLNEKAGLALVSYTIGSVYYKTDDAHLGLKFLLDALDLYQQLNDKFGQSRALKAIGTIYGYMGEYAREEKTYRKVIELCDEIGDKNGKSNALNPLSGIYLKKGNIEKANQLIEESILLKRETNDTRGLAFALYGKGKILIQKKKHSEAEKMFEECLSIHQKAGDLLGEMMCLNKLGKLYHHTDRNQEAKLLLKDCIKKGIKVNHHQLLQKAYLTLFEISKAEDDIKSALEYLEAHNLNKDKVRNKEVKEVIKSMGALSKMEILEKESKWQKEVNERIERKNAELDKFVYKVSHDLRGPITSLMGLYSLVEHEVTDETSKRYFNIYNEQILKINERLIDYINIIQVKDQKIENKKISFTQIIEDCIRTLSYLPNHAHTTFEISIDEGLSFESDESSITTILQNLIENSIKYSSNTGKPKVTISVKGIERKVVIQVKDNGQGIDEKHHDKLFEMFYRANQNVKGTGIGLYLLKHAVKKLKGDMHFKSELGKGTVFTIEFAKELIG